MTTYPLLRSESGFTLIELIMVMVLLGILGAMGAGFISQAFSGFAASDRRLEIYEEGNLAMARMERELQIAVPNAVKVAADAITFGEMDENQMADVFGEYQETGGGQRIEDPAGTLQPDALVSIYNTNWDSFGNGTRIYRVTDLNSGRMILDRSIVAHSPGRRFFAVRDRAVKLYVNGATGTLFRATAPVNHGAPLGAFANQGQILATNLRQTEDASGTPLPYFSYTPGTLTRNAVVSVTFTLARDDEEVAFHKEIQIRNVP